MAEDDKQLTHLGNAGEARMVDVSGKDVTERMAVAPMFWGDRMGMLGGPAGHVLGMATHVENVTPEEMTRRMREHGASQE